MSAWKINLQDNFFSLIFPLVMPRKSAADPSPAVAASAWEEPDYLSEEALSNLKYYKYGASDKSYLSYYILQPYWSWAVQFFPMWMAPNLITLIGFGFMLFNLTILFYKLPDLQGPTDSWVYYSFAAGLWLYSTFDNVDGKQARRTGSSSPLGELFDHGCDALNCSVGGIIQAAAMGFGQGWMSIFVPWISTVAFYFTTWEEYHTGVLHLGLINGPTEGLVLATACMLISGYYGPSFWQRPLMTMLPTWLHGYAPADWTLSETMAWMMVAVLVCFQIPLSLVSVYEACRKKQQSFVKTFPQLLPMLVFTVFGYLWLSAPGSRIIGRDVAVFVLTLGLVFGRMATKIILAYVTRQAHPMFTIQLFPLVIGALFANAPTWFGIRVFNADTERYYLWGYFLFVFVAYFHWALLVIDRFCAHLNIKCLSIPYPSKDAAVKKTKRK